MIETKIDWEKGSRCSEIGCCVSREATILTEFDEKADFERVLDELNVLNFLTVGVSSPTPICWLNHSPLRSISHKIQIFKVSYNIEKNLPKALSPSLQGKRSRS